MTTFILILILSALCFCIGRICRTYEKLVEIHKLLSALLTAMQQIKNTFNKIN